MFLMRHHDRRHRIVRSLFYFNSAFPFGETSLKDVAAEHCHEKSKRHPDMSYPLCGLTELLQLNSVDVRSR